jgi:hypothetical protein
VAAVLGLNAVFHDPAATLVVGDVERALDRMLSSAVVGR